MVFRSTLFCLGAALLALLTACVGYEPGVSPGTTTPKRIFLLPLQNEAYISGIAPLFQKELRRIALLNQNLIVVDSPAEADFEVYVRLADYREKPVAFLPRDSGQAVSSRISLGAFLTVTATADGEPLVEDGYLSAQSAVYSDPPTAFPNPVDQSKPVLARNLAAKVVLAIELAGP